MHDKFMTENIHDPLHHAPKDVFSTLDLCPKVHDKCDLTFILKDFGLFLSGKKINSS